MINSMSSLRVSVRVLMLAAFFFVLFWKGPKRVNLSSNASACRATEEPDSWFQFGDGHRICKIRFFEDLLPPEQYRDSIFN